MGFRRQVTIRRKANSYVDNDGYFHTGSYTEIPIFASVQPLNADDKAQYTQLSKEGERTYSMVKLYTDTLLFLEKQERNLEADILVYSGRLWKVVMVEEWQSNVINHYKVICQEIDNDESEEYHADDTEETNT